MTIQLSRQAETLLSEMARDHGLATLEPDENGLIPIALGDSIALILTFSRANDSCFFISVLDTPSGDTVEHAWASFDTPAGWAARRTRIAVEPSSGCLTLIGELFLKGISYGDFAAALERFVEDIDTARRMMGLGKSTLGATEAAALLSSEDIVIRA